MRQSLAVVRRKSRIARICSGTYHWGEHQKIVLKRELDKSLPNKAMTLTRPIAAEGLRTLRELAVTMGVGMLAGASLPKRGACVQLHHAFRSCLGLFTPWAGIREHARKVEDWPTRLEENTSHDGICTFASSNARQHSTAHVFR